MNKRIKKLILTKRWEHHTHSGGYDRVADYLDGEKIVSRSSDIKNNSLSHRLWNYLVPSSRSVNHYHPSDFYAEMKIFKKSFMQGFDVIHALYGEDQLNFLLRFKERLRSKLIGSFHMPMESEYVQRAIKRNHYNNLQHLDAAIVVSKSMMSDFVQWVGQNKVHVVPHGIDTNTFCPSVKREQESETFRILSVGEHGRDWHAMNEIAKRLQSMTINFKYDLVIPTYIKKRFDDNKHLKFHSKISESKLISLYRNADVLLLPVHFGTANNSILESISCGTPVITTMVGGIPEYVNSRSGWLFNKGDVKSILLLLHEMVKEPAIYISKRESARKSALAFDWSVIAEEITQVYQMTKSINRVI